MEGNSPEAVAYRLWEKLLDTIPDETSKTIDAQLALFVKCLKATKTQV